MMNKFLFTLFIFVGYHSFCQNSTNPDSLFILLTAQQNDSAKVRAIIKISEEFSLSNPKKSLEFAEQALTLSEQINWKRGIAMAYNRISYSYDAQGNFSTALEFRLKELKIREELKDSIGICNALSIIGITYSDQGCFTKAMDYYTSSLKLAEKIRDVERTITNLCNIASIHKELGDTEKSLEYYFKSLNIAKENNFENYIAVNYGNIGNIYNEQGEFNQALEFYLIALEIDQKTGNKRNVAGWLCNIGDAYRFQSDSADNAGNKVVMEEKNFKAIEYYLKAIKLSEDIGNDYILANVFLGIGATHLIGKRYDEAEEYLNKCFELSLKIAYFDVIMLVHKKFSELYKLTNMPDKSFEHFKKYVTLKDSIFNERNKKIISELQIKYESEKKEGENKALAQQNEVQALSIKNNHYFIIGISCFFILILSIGILLFRQNKLKSENLAAEFKQKLLRTQMNPHFIFNSLASIESFIYEHQPKEAGIYLSSFAKLMRLILENSASEYISLEKEIETLNYYLSLQKMRLDDNLDFKIEIDSSVNPEEIELPPMLAQPFIENAIEHGFRGIKHRGKILIKFSLAENNLEVQIIDNGVGIVQAQKQKDLNKLHKSMAMEITHERLSILNKSKKRKLHFTVTDLTCEQKTSGTKVIFSIPV